MRPPTQAKSANGNGRVCAYYSNSVNGDHYSTRIDKHGCKTWLTENLGTATIQFGTLEFQKRKREEQHVHIF